MDNIKNDNYYLAKIITDLKFIADHTAGLTKAGLKSDEVLTDSVMFRLVQISENSVKLTADFKTRYKEVPWHAIKGLRNRIVHEYGEVDISIIYEIIITDVPKLYDLLLPLI